MTVICPSCDARFRDPPASVSSSRPVQCGKCDHQWHIEPGTTERIEMDAPSLAPEMADIVEASSPIITALPVVVEEDQDAQPDDESQPIYVDRVPAPSKTVAVNTFNPILALSVIATLAGGLIFKDAVMAELPQSKAFYKMVGLTSDNPDLEIANIVTTKSDKNGISQLIVKGEIQNIADNTVPIPPLKLTMRGESDANLYAWTVSAAKTSLKAGERSRFTAVAHNFPSDAVNVEVEFAEPAEK